MKVRILIEVVSTGNILTLTEFEIEEDQLDDLDAHITAAAENF